MCKRTMYKRARIPMFLWERRACANSGAQPFFPSPAKKRPGNEASICPVPNCSFYIGSESPCDHFLSAHTSLDISLDNFIYACTYFSVSLFSYGHVLQNSFKSVWNH